MEEPKDVSAVEGKSEWWSSEKKIDCTLEKDAQHTVEFNGWWYAEEEIAEVRRRFDEMQAAYFKKLRKDWEESPQGKLCLELYAKYLEYKKFLEKNPYVPGARFGIDVEYPEHMLIKQALVGVSEYQQARAEKDRRNLVRAHTAARCQHTYLDGRQCGAARVRGKKLCRMHLRMEELQTMKELPTMKVDLGSMEDPDSIQLAIMKLQRAVVDGTLDGKQVSGLSYLVQLAAWNVTRTSFASRSAGEERGRTAAILAR